MCTNYFDVTYYFKFAPPTAYISHTFYLQNLPFMVGVLKSISYVVHVYRRDNNHIFFFQNFLRKNRLVVNSKKHENNFAGWMWPAG
jgi:hypothetical protein